MSNDSEYREPPEEWERSRVENMAANRTARGGGDPLVSNLRATDDEERAAQELYELRDTRDARMRETLGSRYAECQPSAVNADYANWWRRLAGKRASTVVDVADLLSSDGRLQLTGRVPDLYRERPTFTWWFSSDNYRRGSSVLYLYNGNPRYAFSGTTVPPAVVQLTRPDAAFTTVEQRAAWRNANPANLPIGETWFDSANGVVRGAPGMRNAAIRGYIYKNGGTPDNLAAVEPLADQANFLVTVSNIRQYVQNALNEALLSQDVGVLDADAGATTADTRGDPILGTETFGEAETLSDSSREGPIARLAESHFMWRYYEYIMDRRTSVNITSNYALGSFADPVPTSEVETMLAEVIETAVDLIIRRRLWDQAQAGEVAVEAAIAEGRLSGDIVDATSGALLGDAQGIWDQAEFDRSTAFGEGSALDAAEAARLKRLAEQCFMMDNLTTFAEINMKVRNPSYFNPAANESDFIMLQGKTDTIVNQLMHDPQKAQFDEFTPADIASLVPQIRIFKEFVAENGSVETVEVPFYDHIRPPEIEHMLNSTFDRGQGVGIKSFDWRLEGQNPFTARRDIFAELKLHFQSMDELIKERTLEGRAFRYVDLINIGLTERLGSEFDFIWNPDYYKLKIQVGWAPIGGDWELLSTEKKRAVNASNMVLTLTAIDHTFDITDEGNVNLSIEYVAYQEGSYLDSDSDVLVSPEIQMQRLRIREFIAKKRAEGCSDAYIKELREQYSDILDKQNYAGWQTLINRLKAEDRIYQFTVCRDTLNEYVQEVAVAQTRGLRDVDCANETQIELQSASSIASIVNSVPTGPTRNQEGEEEPLLQQLSALTYEDTGFVGDPVIQYFFFGDLVQAALSLINRSVPAQQGEHAGVNGKLQKQLKVLLGPISYVTKDERLVYNVNLADIPISLKYYIDWFLAKAVGTDREFYPVLAFIRDLSNTFIANIMRNECINMQKTNRQNIQLRTNFFTAAAPGGSDRLESQRNWPVGENEKTRLDVDEWHLARENQGRTLLRPPDPNGDAYHYMLLYALNSGAVIPLNGDIEEDEDRGIYHFGIGQDRGIFKSVRFTKTEIPGLRESRWRRDIVSELSGLAILANVYEAEVKTVGNTMFAPGMKIFIDPTGISPMMRNAADPTSAARKLGIGGYHVVTSVSSYIEGGKFETTVKAIFEAAGTGNDPIITQQSPQAGGTVTGADVPEECRAPNRVNLLEEGNRGSV
jgi:hypothetical protein